MDELGAVEGGHYPGYDVADDVASVLADFESNDDADATGQTDVGEVADETTPADEIAGAVANHDGETSDHTISDTEGEDPRSPSPDSEDPEVASLPPEARDLVRAQDEHWRSEFEELDRQAETLKDGLAWTEAVEPFEPYLAAIRTTPQDAMRMLLGAEYTLRNGSPEQRSRILSQLARDYKIDTNAIVDTIEGYEPDPQVSRLNDRVAGVERFLAHQRQQAAAEVRQQADGVVRKFADARDEQGKLLHPHFERVRQVMGRMMRETPGISLDEAYQNATWSDAELRERQLAQRRAKQSPKKPSHESKPAKTANQREPSLREDLLSEYQRAEERIPA